MKFYNRIKLRVEKQFRALHDCPREKMLARANSGFSLLETLVAIVVFSIVITSIGSSLVMSHRINSRSELLLQEQLKVSRAVEGIMASGIDSSLSDMELADRYRTDYPEVIVTVNRGSLQEKQTNMDGSVTWNTAGVGAFCTVIIQSRELTDDVKVITYVRLVEPPEVGGGA